GAAGQVAQLRSQPQGGVGVGVVQLGADGDVLEVGAGNAVEVHFPEDPGEVPEVHVLQVGAGAPPVHLDGDGVGAGPQVRGDVEFGRGVAALVVADVVAVDPDEVAAGDAFEPEQLAAPRPVLREFELLAVGPGGVDVVGHLRWAVGRDLGGDVAVDGPVVALLLPHPGHVHGVPLPAAPLPAGREVPVVVGVLELPPAVQRQRPRGGFVGRGEEVLAGAAQGLFGVGVGAQEGVRRLLAFPGALRVFQVGLDLGGIAGTV